MNNWWNVFGGGGKTPKKAAKKGGPKKNQPKKQPLKQPPKTPPQSTGKSATTPPAKTTSKTTPKTSSNTETPKSSSKFTSILPKTTSKDKKDKKAEKKSIKKEEPEQSKGQASVDPSFNLKAIQEHFGSRLSPLNKPSGQGLYDVCAYLIHCPTHDKIAISREEKTNYVWLPFVAIGSGQSWTEGAIEGAYIVISGGEPNAFADLRQQNAIEEAVCMELFRLQLPQTQKFNIRITCYMKFVPKNKDFPCCTETSRLVWVPLADIKAGKIENLFGPEVEQFAKEIPPEPNPAVNEYSLDDAFKYVPRDPPRNLEEDMLKSTNFTEKDVERLYTDFIEHCFPSFFMTKTSFNDYMFKYGFEKMDKKLLLLFNAFNYNKNQFLSFYEFLLGLTSIEPMATNGLSRIKFVFKYFDVDQDGLLNEAEFSAMVRELNPNDKDATIQKKAKEATKAIGQEKGKGIDFERFSRAVGSHKFRGTSGLCRSNRPIVAQISRSMATRTLKKVSGKSTLGAILADRKYKSVCQTCQEKKYEFATHIVHLNEEGCVGAKLLPEFSQLEKTEKTESQEKIGKKESQEKSESKEKIEAKDKTEPKEKTGSKENSEEKSDSENPVKSSPSSSGIISFSSEKFSRDIVWNQKSVANYFIQKIRAFNLKKGTKDQKKGLMDSEAERPEFVKRLKELCAEVSKIVAQDDRCCKVTSPAFIVGDIHGNLEDLMTMEKVLWKSMPIVAANYVFLGDYVDRGQWGLECALYLMCLKLLAPNKVVMLRGNHEVRELQKTYTYKKECDQKYGKFGEEVFEMTNKVFDKLPFCAVVDDAIFCAHGGIPCTTRQLDKINEVGNDLPDPERQSAIAWEILWSDPIGAQEFTEAADLLQVRVDTARGFLTNQKRGTAFLYGEEGANTFLQTNGLTHIVRAHEVPAYGYTFHFGNKCTTVFSSSHYCGNNNEAAVIHVDNEKLRVVRLDTVNNAAAS